MRALYHIEQELNEINETLINSGGELSPELETRLAITQEELATKATNYGFVILQNQSEIDIIEAEIKRLTAIKKSLDATNEKLKDAVSFAMQNYGLTEVKAPTLKLSFRQSESVEITDENKLNAKYFSYKPTVDKTAIKSDIKSGLVVDGAQIITKQNLQVK
jgi:hypothetical protein